MANYEGKTRTNYFRVKDEEYFKNVISYMGATTGTVEYWTKQEDNQTYYAFGCTRSLLGIYKIEKEDFDFDEAINLLQSLVHEEDAIIMLEVGYRNLEFVDACSTIITSNSIDYLNLMHSSIEKAKELLNNKDYEPECSY